MPQFYSDDGQLTTDFERSFQQTGLTPIVDPHSKFSRTKTGKVLDLEARYPKGFAEIESAVSKLNEEHLKKSKAGVESGVVITVEVSCPKEVSALVTNGHKGIVQGHFDRAFRLNSSHLTVALNERVL